MRWPWQKRQSAGGGGFTNLYLQSQLLRAEGVQKSSTTGLAAVEASARFYRSAFQSAEIEGDGMGVLTPILLGHIAQELIRRGQSLLEIRHGMNGVRLLPSSYWYAVGSADPETWAFQVTADGPTDTETRVVLHEDVVFCRYAFDPRSPWIGVGPMQAAIRSGTLAANLESALGDEASAAVAMIVPFPERSLPEGDGDEPEFDPLGTLTDQLAKLRGALALVESTSGGHGDRGQAPQTDWKQMRLGPQFTEPQVKLREAVTRSIYSACGIPAALVDPTAAAASREAFREFVFNSVLPLARGVETELSEKLGSEIKLSFRKLMASDVQGRARAVKSLTDSGTPLAEAMHAVLFDEGHA